MNSLRQLWERLTTRHKITIGVAILVVVAGISALNRWNQERDFKPLFSGLAAEDAGTIAAKLRETGVEYRLSDGGSTILIRSEQVAETRLQLASAGLPKSGRIGFELFDRTNFGISDFTEQVNYNRAIEGELERSVMSLREVEQARVHVTPAKDSIYTEQRQPAKASILVKLGHLASLSPQNVAAICQLAASAVPGLAADHVTLIDTSGNLLNRPRPGSPGDGTDLSEAALDYKQSLEKDLQSKAAATLEPLLGANHFRLGVAAELDPTSGDLSEETFDPQKSAVNSSQRSEDGPALASASGVPGTPSNLPRPTSTPGTGAGNFSRKTENVTYQTSRVVKHTKLPAGMLTRLSISLLLDTTALESKSMPATGPEVTADPMAARIQVIRGLVAAATGIDTQRGDQMVVEALPFGSPAFALPEAQPLTTPGPQATSNPVLPWIDSLVNHPLFRVAAGALGALLLLSLGWLVIRRKKAKLRAEQAAAALSAAQAKELPSPENLEKELEARIDERAAEVARKEAEALMKLKLPSVATKKTTVLARHIVAESKKDPEALAQVVRSWLNAQERHR